MKQINYEIIKEADIYKGLSSIEVKRRLKKYGYNEIVGKKKKSPLKVLFEQFNDFIVWVLIGATLISAFMGEAADAITILIIILLDAVLGFIQEYRTEKSLEALKELASPSAKVIRDGKKVAVKAKEVVIGDVLVLESGDRIPADSVVISGKNIESDESILTGESVPIHKKLLNKGNKPKAENFLYMGCIITKGSGLALTAATGMNTEVGKIANMLDDIEDSETPLQKKLNEFGKLLVIGCIAICAVVSIMGIIRGEDAYTMFMTGVSLAVAAIPEGLPAVVTVSLAIGVQKMMKKNALVRKLPAVETLGCTNVICSDKTGTLTQNKMTVKKIYTYSSYYDVDGSGYDLKGEIKSSSSKINAKNNLSLKKLLEGCLLCNNAEYDGVKFNGDPTEIALLVLAYKAGVRKEKINKEIKLINEYPFDSDRKMMSIICRYGNDTYMFSKGAVENILNKSSRLLIENEEKKLTEPYYQKIMESNNEMAKSALRVIAFAYKKIEGNDYSEDNLIFTGLCGMIDPPRKEVKDAIAECKIAGITPVMITGDHKLTAEAIAKQIKLMDNDSIVVTGQELDKMSDKDLYEKIDNIRVFARVNPSHKYRIVKCFKSKGYVVAMTGDGVNDAPAVKEADIGIAMGESGTDVTREASSMILLDDNFTTIVSAVQEGRAIYDNIRKFIRYLLSCNIGEVLTMFLASVLSLPVPLYPIQILLVNLATDGLPAMALSFEPAEDDIMMRKPRGKDESIFSYGLNLRIIFRGILIGICTILSYVISLAVFKDEIECARTVALCTLIMSQLFHVFECKSEHQSIFKVGILNNIYLIFAVMASIIMVFFAVYYPYFQNIFHTVGINFEHWILVFIFSGITSLISSLFWFGKKK